MPGPAPDADDVDYEDADAISTSAYEDAGAIAFVSGSTAVYNHLFEHDGNRATGAAADRYRAGPAVVVGGNLCRLALSPYVSVFLRHTLRGLLLSL